MTTNAPSASSKDRGKRISDKPPFPFKNARQGKPQSRLWAKINRNKKKATFPLLLKISSDCIKTSNYLQLLFILYPPLSLSHALE